MPDLLQEELLTCSAAARLLREIDAGRRYAPSTIWRWMTRGVQATSRQRIVLESVRLGRRLLTSREALNRFAHAAARSGVMLEWSHPVVQRGAARTRLVDAGFFDT